MLTNFIRHNYVLFNASKKVLHVDGTFMSLNMVL